jgi:hypothetical protein
MRAVITAAISIVAIAATSPVVVKLKDGSITGIETGLVRESKGIPFAVSKKVLAPRPDLSLSPISFSV